MSKDSDSAKTGFTPPPSVVKTTGTHCTQYIYEDMNKYTNI